MTANLFLLNQSLLQPTFPRPPVCTCKGAAAPLPRRPAEMAENRVIIIGCSFIYFSLIQGAFPFNSRRVNDTLLLIENQPRADPSVLLSRTYRDGL